MYESNRCPQPEPDSETDEAIRQASRKVKRFLDAVEAELIDVEVEFDDLALLAGQSEKTQLKNESTLKAEYEQSSESIDRKWKRY